MNVFDDAYDYDVALSYAEEDRAYAEGLFSILDTNKVKVFYDKYNTSALWGKDLYTYLSDLYQNRARYCVMFLSKHYAAEFWTNHERQAAQARAFQEHREYILPVRLDNTPIPGIPPTISYISCSSHTLDIIAQAIMEKLGKASITSPYQLNTASSSYLEKLLPPAQTMDTNSTEYWLNKGIHYYKEKNYKEALTAYEKAIQLDEKASLAYLGKANALHKLKRYPKALAAYEQTIQLDPTIVYAYCNKGQTLSELGRIEEAIVAFDHSIRLKPEYIPAYHGKGNLLIKQGKHGEALKTFRKAIRLDSNNALSYCGKGTSFFHLAEYKQALSAFEKATQLDPNLAAAYDGQGNVYYQSQNYAQALTAHDRATLLDSKNSLFYHHRGNDLFKLQRLEEALTAFEQSIKLDKKNYEAYQAKGLLLLRQKKYPEALPAFEKVIQLVADNSEGYRLKGAVLYCLEHFEDAFIAFDQAAKLLPDDINIQNARKDALQRIKNHEKVLQTYEQIINTTPNDARAYKSKGELLDRLGRFREAQRMYEIAESLSPTNQNQKTTTLKPLKAMIFTSHPIAYRAVRTHVVVNGEETHQAGTIYEQGNFSSGGQTWQIGLVEIDKGNTSTALEVERAINYYHPDIILFIGIAYGRKDVNPGDVVVATKVYEYDSGNSREIFQIMPEIGNSTYRSIQRAKAEARESNWLKRLTRPIPSPIPHVFVAPIAAGEKLITSRRSDIWQLLESCYDDAVAVDMEGYGFLKAAHANQHVEALIIRGIPNIIGAQSESISDEQRSVAAQHASAFAFEILSKLHLK